MEIAFGRHKNIDQAFKAKVIGIASNLKCDPSHLMAAMAFETGERFKANTRNSVSGATGLIQFMPSTAKALGTTTDKLAQMTELDQLDYVETYLKPYTGKMGTVSDVYMTILYPAAVGKDAAHVLFAEGSKAYGQNRGLDVNRDGTVTKAEAAAKVYAKLIRGLRDDLRG
ncbi:MAG: lytic transglycosylase [Methylorubrum populi]